MVMIRTYKEGDENGFLSLDRLIEIHPWNRRDITNWNWKYKGNNPAGESIIYVAENDNELVAYFAALPMRYWINGEDVIGSHSIAMMVKPEWQNKGLIKFVGDKLMKELEEKEIAFTYGYPNENAYELHLKFWNYKLISMQTLYELNIGDELMNSAPNPSNLVVKEIERFDESVNSFWEKEKNNYNAIVVRDDSFLNWRYIDRPDAKYHALGIYDNAELCGYCILKLYKEGEIRRGHIIDYFSRHDSSECAEVLVDNSLKYFKKNKVDEVNLWMQGSIFNQEILKKFGFVKGVARPMICRFNLEEQNHASFLTEENWYFSMGDTLEIY